MKRSLLSFITGICGFLILTAGLIIFAINTFLTTVSTLLITLGLVLLLLFFVASLDMIKSWLLKRGTKYNTNLIIMIGIVIVLIGMINFITSKHNKRFDVTASSYYSLSEQSMVILKSLDKDITFHVFAKDAQKQILADLIDEYIYHSTKITASYYDLNKKPGLAKHYGVIREGSVIIESGEKYKKIEEEPSEQIVTNAILELTKEKRITIYFSSGHGERNMENNQPDGYSAVKKQLEGQNFKIKSVVLMREGMVPEDCDVLIIAGLAKELSDSEKTMLMHYLQGSGNVLFLVDPHKYDFNDILEPWGVVVGQDIVVDINPAGKSINASEFMPVITKYYKHAITKDFKFATMFPMSRSVRKSMQDKEGVKVTPLITTSTKSWAETNLTEKKVMFNEGEDVKGPIAFAAAVSSAAKDREEYDTVAREEIMFAGTRLVIIGDSDFASNKYISFSGNKDFILNIVSWLAHEENLISIRPKHREDRRVFLTQKDRRLVFSLTIFIIPGLVILAGIGMWWRRRG